MMTEVPHCDHVLIASEFMSFITAQFIFYCECKEECYTFDKVTTFTVMLSVDGLCQSS